MKFKKILFIVVLVGILAFIGMLFFIKSTRETTANSDYLVSVNEKKEKNDITLLLENLILEDKKVTVYYNIDEYAEKIASIKLFVNEKELKPLTEIEEGKKNNHCSEILFNETPYKLGDTLKVQFLIYDINDKTMSNQEKFTFSIPVNKILPTTELNLAREVPMKNGDPRLIHKVLITATKVHVFHEAMNVDMQFKSKSGETYYKLSAIGLGKTEELSNIPIQNGDTNGTLHITGNSLTEELSIPIN